MGKELLFIRSDTGQRGRSELGVFGGEEIIESMVLCFIDESGDQPTSYNNHYNSWIYDLTRWKQTINRYGNPKYGCGVYHVSQEDGSYIDISFSDENELPVDGTAYFRGTRTWTGHLNVDLASILEIYNITKNSGWFGSNPERVIIVIDISGSMDRSNVGPGIDDFENWLDGEGIPWAEKELPDEAWLRWMRDYGYITSSSYLWDWYQENFG